MASNEEETALIRGTIESLESLGGLTGLQEKLDPESFLRLQAAQEKVLARMDSHLRSAKHTSRNSARHDWDPEAERKAIADSKAAEEAPWFHPDKTTLEVEEEENDVLKRLIPDYETDLDKVYSSAPWDDMTFALFCCGILLLVLIAATFGFWWLESDQDWSFLDAWYFTVVTANTVGYGILVPSNDTTRLCVVLFLIFIMVFSVFALSILTEYLLKNMEEWTQKHQLHRFSPFDARVLSLSILLLLLLSVGTCYGVFFEGWNFIQSLYWTMVTLSTVGYGDFVPRPGVGRAFVSVYTLLAGGMYAAIVTLTIASYLNMRKRAIAIHLLFMQLTEEELAKMPKNADGQIGRRQFQEYMLVKMGYCEESTVAMINDCFASMDMDGSGILDRDDIVSNEEGLALLQYMRMRYGVQGGDDEVVPWGFFGLRRSFTRDPPKMTEEDHRRAFAAIRTRFRKNRETDKGKMAWTEVKNEVLPADSDASKPNDSEPGNSHDKGT